MAALTLSEKSALAENPLFRSRLLQALFSKANYFRTLTSPNNVKQFKQKSYACNFVLGGANSIDIYAVARLWLANYNTETPDLIQSGSPELIGQPTDNELLSAYATDVVFETMSKIDEGDDLLPINTTL